MKFKIKNLLIFIIQALLIAKIALQTTNTPLTTTPSAISVQTNPIPIEKPEDCIFPSQYYDIARLRCLNCPANSSAAENRFNCKCGETFRFTVNNGGGSIECTRCLDGQVQSLDGFSCVECLGDCLRCQNNSYLTDTFSNGTLLSAGRECVFCDTKDSVLSGNSCKSCKPLLYSQSNTLVIKDAECNDNSFVTLGGLIFTETTYAGEPNYFNYFYDTNIGVSWYFLEYLRAAYRQCKTPMNRNQTACQNLANMCVLNLYLSPSNNNPSLPLLDSCLTFNVLYSDQITNNDQTRMPWLVYTNNFAELKSSYLQTGINTEYLAIKFGNSISSQLQFYAASYELSGKFLSLEPIDISKLNLCYLESPFTSSIKNLSPFTTTNLYQSCSIRVSDLLKSYDNKVQIFYDLYVRYGNGTSLYPVPVKLSTNNDIYQKNDEFSIQRRFFLADVVSTKNTIDQPSVYIRYAKSIKLRIDLIDEKSNGEIYPPVLFIEYAYALRTNENQSITFKFEVEYKMDINTQYLILFICVGVLSGLAFIWSCIRIWIWNRRSGRFALDIISLFKFFMFLLGSVGSCLFYTVVGWSLYWLCFYRGQSVAFIFLPIESQETIFNLFIIIGFVLKLIDVLYLIFVQTSYDIFFIDWERPRAYDSGRDLIKSQKQTRLPPIEQQKDKFLESYKLGTEKETTKEIFKQTNVSCWRTLFVANEWNELQTYRKVNSTFQLIAVLFLLKVINLEALTLRDISGSLNRDVNEYKAPYSSVLRAAIASSMYLALGLFQWLFNIVIYSRCFEDKIGQFIDFCSVSNISMFIMTHTQFGFYIHGRSPHGYADSNMHQMTEALLKEEEDLTSKRGLEQGSDHQTFSINISSKLSKQYSKVMLPLQERRPRASRNLTNEFEKRMLAYGQLNRFLIAFIDNILREMKYSVVRRNFCESIFDLEFKDPVENGYFYEDDQDCFTEAIFYGKERTLFIFDLLLFLFVDYFSQNYVLAAFVVYLVTRVLKTLRSDLGKRNLSRKTLVDKRFLI